MDNTSFGYDRKNAVVVEYRNWEMYLQHQIFLISSESVWFTENPYSIQNVFLSDKYLTSSALDTLIYSCGFSCKMVVKIVSFKENLGGLTILRKFSNIGTKFYEILSGDSRVIL
jgi:hypothetical protein